MIRKHLTTRVSLITVVAGWAVACGGAGEPTEGSAAATQALVAAPTQISTKTAVVKSVSSIPTVIFTPTPAPQPPITGPIPANASAPIPCSTPDENVKLPDGTMGTLAQDSPWFDGIVSFRLDASVAPGSATERAIVDAIRHYNFMTSVRLVHDVNSTQTDHVLFTTDRGTSCKSIGIGFQGGTHVVNLFSPPTGNTCANFDVAVHEIGHRVGLHHEQRRPDRDKFILIQDGQIHDGVRTNNNIKPGKLSNFEIFQGPGYQVGGFDFDSVMLYPSVTSDPNFAEDVTQPIITRRDGSIYPDPQTGGLSVGDTNTLFVLYPPPPLTSNIGNTCRTAPIKRSKLPINPALFPKPTELMCDSPTSPSWPRKRVCATS